MPRDSYRDRVFCVRRSRIAGMVRLPPPSPSLPRAMHHTTFRGAFRHDITLDRDFKHRYQLRKLLRIDVFIFYC